MRYSMSIRRFEKGELAGESCCGSRPVVNRRASADSPLSQARLDGRRVQLEFRQCSISGVTAAARGNLKGFENSALLAPSKAGRRDLYCAAPYSSSVTCSNHFVSPNPTAR